MPDDLIDLTVAVTADHVFILDPGRSYRGLRVRAPAMLRGLTSEPGIYRLVARHDPRNPSFLDVLRYEEYRIVPTGTIVTVTPPSEETTDADRDDA